MYIHDVIVSDEEHGDSNDEEDSNGEFWKKKRFLTSFSVGITASNEFAVIILLGDNGL